MNWTLSASGKLSDETAHLEQQFIDELHALLSRFGMQSAHFRGPTADVLSGGDVLAGTASAEAAKAADPAAEDAVPADAGAAKPAKAAAKTAGG